MKKLCLLFLLILFTVVFVACGGEAEVTNTPASTETAVPTNTAAPTAAPTDTVEPTSPPTDTPEPPATDTPEPTATAVPLPDFIEFNDNDLVFRCNIRRRGLLPPKKMTVRYSFCLLRMKRF